MRVLSYLASYMLNGVTDNELAAYLNVTSFSPSPKLVLQSSLPKICDFVAVTHVIV